MAQRLAVWLSMPRGSGTSSRTASEVRVIARPPPFKRFLVVTIVLSMMTTGGHGFATSKEACVKAFEDGQVYRRESKLVEAREQLSLCAQADCPKIVSGKCAE